MTSAAQDIIRDLKKASSKEYAKTAAYFFKTGPGQYGEGDIFIGVRVPVIRAIVKKYSIHANMADSTQLIKSPIHEERTAGTFLLVERFSAKKSTDTERKAIYDFYMKNAERMNNWDLVDLSAPRIPGVYLFDKDRSILYTFARSKNLWKRRISIIATQGFIKRGDIADTFTIADLHMDDTHDLMHKATGWMLREAGKKDKKALVDYLKTRYAKMPRTMLRYAIEKFPESERKKYLRGDIQ